MALNLASGLQVSAHFFWNRRNAAALSHHGVRMEFDPVQRQRASLILGFIFALLAVALMFVLVLVQARRTGRTVGDPRGPRHRRDLRPRRRPSASGGQPDQRAPHRRAGEQPHLRQGQRDRQVPPGRVGRHRRGACGDAAADGRQLAVDGLRQRADNPNAAPLVTAIGGPLTGGSRAMPLDSSKAVLAEHDDKTYVIWNGQRSVIDLSNKAVALALGVDTDAPPPVKLSTPLFDALPATEPLNSPVIPGAGGPSQFKVATGRRGRLGAVGARPADRRRQLLCAAAQRCPADLAVRRVTSPVVQLLRRRTARGGCARPTGHRARCGDSSGRLLPDQSTGSRRHRAPIRSRA